jgi:hypothetical protein
VFSDLAGYIPRKFQFSGKPLIVLEPKIGKFQNWAEMKDNYPTDNKVTSKDFSDNFHNIKNSVQVDHIEKTRKTVSFFLLAAPKNRRWSEKI